MDSAPAATTYGCTISRGWAYVSAGKADLARADFAEALRIDPDNPESHAGLGFAGAQSDQSEEARSEASAALLRGCDNYLVMHNVACIYGLISQSAKEDKLKHENLALGALKRAVAIARKSGEAAAEAKYIRGETLSFSDSLRARREFQQLIEELEL